MMPGFALARMHVHVGACDVSCRRTERARARAMQLFRPSGELDHEAELRLVVFAAVGTYTEAITRRPTSACTMRDSMSNSGWPNAGSASNSPCDVKRHAGVGAKPVPVRVVVLELDLLGNLRKLGLQLLQAHDVRPVALHPFAKLRLARAHAVDVPGGDFHFRCVPKEILRYLTLRRDLCDAGGAIEEELLLARVAP